MFMLRRLSALVIVFSMVWGTVGFVPERAAHAAEEGSAAFVSEFWRMFIHQVEVGADPAKLRLDAESGNELLVAVVDVTNFGTEEAALSLDDIELIPDSSSDPIAAEKTGNPSKELGMSDVKANGTATVGVDSTVRVAAAFWVPEESIEDLDPALSFLDESVSVDKTVVDSLDVKSLDSPEPWSGKEGVIQEVSGDGKIEIAVGGDAQTVPLTGTTTPPVDECFGSDSSDAILALTGGSVYVEDDPTSDGKLVWFFDSEVGYLRLLNQALIEQGFGAYDDAYDDSAYASWFEAMEKPAKDQETGLWSLCRNASGAYINPPTPTAEEVRGEYTEIDTRDLVIRPDTFTGEKIIVGGEVFNIQVEGSTTFMQIFVAGNEAVGVVYEGDSTGIYEGTYVTIYGVGRGTFDGTNAFGGPITQPLIEADIVDF